MTTDDIHATHIPTEGVDGLTTRSGIPITFPVESQNEFLVQPAIENDFLVGKSKDFPVRNQNDFPVKNDFPVRKPVTFTGVEDWLIDQWTMLGYLIAFAAGISLVTGIGYIIWHTFGWWTPVLALIVMVSFSATTTILESRK